MNSQTPVNAWSIITYFMGGGWCAVIATGNIEATFSETTNSWKYNTHFSNTSYEIISALFSKTEHQLTLQTILYIFVMYSLFVWFQASAVMQMISEFFWDFTQHRVVIPHWCFGTPYQSHQIAWPLKMVTTGCPEMSLWIM